MNTCSISWGSTRLLLIVVLSFIVSNVSGVLYAQSVIVDFNLPDLYLAFEKASNNPNARTKTYWNLPKPDGNTLRVEVSAAPIMSEDFMRYRLNFQSYEVVGINDKTEIGRMVLTPFGLHGLLRTKDGMISIDAIDPLNPISHRVEFLNAVPSIHCETKSGSDSAIDPHLKQSISQIISSGAQLRTYDLAIVCTYQFYLANGSNVSIAESRVMNTISDLNMIYEQELAVQFTGLTPIIKTTSDDMIDGTLGTDRPEIAAAIVAQDFNLQSYDIGHVFHNDGIDNEFDEGGVAQLNSVCSEDLMDNEYAEKGAGWSGSSENISVGWVSLVAHEIGHQFGMNHTFSGVGSGCLENIDTFTSFEIGSGSTIMAYNGLCDPEYNIPSSGSQDLYFHHQSLMEALAHIGAISCHDLSGTGNSPPNVSVNSCGGSTNIPLGTPFRLVGFGQDPNGDPIYYGWEQMDTNQTTFGLIGAAAANDDAAPLFRSYPPTTDPVRVFPRMSLIAAGNYSSSFEALPQVPRTLNFMLTARDRRGGGGGIHSAPLSITVANSGPLEVNYSPGSVVNAGTNVTINWSVNGTHTQSSTVNVRLSVDGGLTFPYTLASGLTNNGSAMVTIPSNTANTTEARVMVESADNPCIVFFDISDTDFEISSSCLAQVNQICPAEMVAYEEGNSGLNFNLHSLFGKGMDKSQIITINGASAMGDVASLDMPGGSCESVQEDKRYESISFYVEKSGSYTFVNSNFDDFGFNAYFSLFNENGYNPATPCSGSLITSNFDGSVNPEFTTTLVACAKYELVIWVDEDLDFVLSIAGPGGLIGYEEAPAAPYQYTYVAVNVTTGQVANVSESANFTVLGAGSYEIFGASYDGNSVTPGQWLDNTLDQIYDSGNCVFFSSNSKTLIITGDCPSSLMLDDTPIVAGVYQSSNIITSMGRVASGSSVTFDAGQTVELTANFEVESTATFEIKLQGCQ